MKTGEPAVTCANTEYPAGHKPVNNRTPTPVTGQTG